MLNELYTVASLATNQHVGDYLQCGGIRQTCIHVFCRLKGHEISCVPQEFVSEMITVQMEKTQFQFNYQRRLRKKLPLFTVNVPFKWLQFLKFRYLYVLFSRDLFKRF